MATKTAVWDERGKAFRLWIGCEDKEIAFVCFEKEQLLKMPICVGAALIAHEFLHVFDCLNKTFGINIYDHTNVYLFQMLVQDSLQEIYGAEFKHAHAAMVP